MKTIIIDLFSSQPKNGIKYHGGGEYCKTVFKALVTHDDFEGNQLEVCLNNQEFIDEWIKNLIKEKNIKVNHVTSELEIVSLLEEKKDKNLVFFTGMIYLYRSDLVRFPDEIVTIGTCHGLRTLEKPHDKLSWKYYKGTQRIKELIKSTFLKQYLYRKHLSEYQKSLENFDIIITVSQHSNYSIKTFFPELSRRIDIRTLYTPFKNIEKEDYGCEALNNENYIMLVSADRWLKNSFRGILAIDDLYSKSFLQGIKTKVYGNFPIHLKNLIKNKENFIFKPYVSTLELESAYQNCTLFFYPTLNEGFGLPPLEAMKYGKTCVISGVCSLPEVYGNSVYYCNPYDINEMENRILYGLENKIDEQLIRNRLLYIEMKQKEDLITLCDLIYKGR